MPGVTIEKPKTSEDNLPVHIKKSDISIEALPSFKDAAGEPKRALVDADGHAQVDVLEMPSVSVEPSFKDAAGNPQRALVDADQHVQADVLNYPLQKGDWLSTLPVTKGDWLSTLPVTKGDWLSALPNPSNLDVPLSTRASENTLKLILSRWIPPGAAEKSWSANASPTAAGDCTLVDYVPASGKVVRITDITVSADVDGHARVMWGTTQLWKQFLTAKIPGGQSFTRALSVTGDGTTHLQLIVYASAAGNVTGTMLGYEV